KAEPKAAQATLEENCGGDAPHGKGLADGKSPMVGGTAFELSEEERRMNGAPQGEIFSVTVKETADLEASLDVGQDIEAVEKVHRAVEGGTDLKWVDLFSGVDAGRRLLRHHYRRESLNQVEENRIKMSVMMTLAVEATKRRESNCCRNGLLLMEEILSSPGATRVALSDVTGLMQEALRHAVSDKVFMAKAAKKVMEAAVSRTDSRQTL
ncbi:unnamed protein product, partial [Ascophyllum nodosum]